MMMMASAQLKAANGHWRQQTASFGTIGGGNAQGNGTNSRNALLEVPTKSILLREKRIATFFQVNKVQLEKLKEAEKKAKPIIQAIQEKIDESAKVMATRNAEHQKQISELEVFIIE
jgi:hypothetical protein